MNQTPDIMIFRLYIIFMVIIVLLGTGDLILDQLNTGKTFHSIIEITFIIFAVISSSWMWLVYKKNNKMLQSSENRVMELTAQRQDYLQKHENLIRGMKEAITSQLEKWGLSAAEVEITLLLMRGYSHKQIAARLDKSEKTVRNQSLAVYKKTGMTGRNDLTAFFIEDIFSLDDD